ncbi:DUF11 domain-containing protein [Glaciimonas sp. GS1]|uniref:DUF11 domain-containing protein n=1 Tax=Glaciimonas soli TaxID=2590999 RepID=A0A843YS69_9BURK|nr:DUF11 domain-containing protein [Glaciimonas soli]
MEYAFARRVIPLPQLFLGIKKLAKKNLQHNDNFKKPKPPFYSAFQILHKPSVSVATVVAKSIAIFFSVSCVLFSNAALAQSVDVNKSFDPVQIQDSAPFNKSRLTISISNTDPLTSLSQLNLTDNLPTGVIIATPPNTSTSCGATVNATAGASSLRISEGTIITGNFCSFQVDVVSTSASVYTNTIPAGAPLAIGQVVRENASASLTVIRRNATPPQVSGKAFSPNTIVSGQTSQMTITLNNANLLPLTNTNMTDNLPAGMVLANPPNASTTCTGTIAATAGGSSLGMTGATIPGGANCTVTATVVGTATVNLINSMGPGSVTSLNGQVTPPLASTGTTNGTLSVTPVPSNVLTKAFSTGSPYVGQSFSMTWTIYNNTGGPWNGMAVTDNLPAGLNVYTTAPNASTTCGGSVTAPNSSTVKLSGATLAAGRSCTVTINVVAPTGTTGQVLVNTIPANSLTATNTAITQATASAQVSLIAPGPGTGPTLSSMTKTYIQLVTEASLSLPTGHAPATVTGGAIDMSIQLNKSVPTGGVNMDLTPIHMVDSWAATAPNFHYSALVSNTCGGTVTAPANGQTLTIDNGLIPQASTSCTIRVRLIADSIITPAPPANGTPENNQAAACVSAVTGNTACSGGVISNVAAALVVGNQPLYPAKSFNPTSIPLNGTSAATITIINPASVPRYNVSAADTLPAQLVFAAPLNPVFACSNSAGAVTTYQVSGQTITFQISRLNAFTTSATPPQCTMTFNVAAAPGVPANSVATNSILANAVTATDVNSNPDPSATNIKPADANLTISNPLTAPQVSKSFNPVTVFQYPGSGPVSSNFQGTGVGQMSTLTIQVINSNTLANSNFTGTNLTDNLPNGVVIAPTPNITKSNCGSPTVTAAAGATSVVITNATVTSGSSCVVTVNVVGTVKGNQTNIIPAGAVQTAQTVTNSLPANSTLTVLTTTPIHALFKDVMLTGTTTSLVGQAIPPGANLTYLLRLTNPGYLPVSLANDVQFVKDALPAGVTFVSAANGGVLNGNTVQWSFAGSTQTLTAGQDLSLTFSVKVNNPVTAPVINIANTATVSDCSPQNGLNCALNPPVANCTMPADPLNESAAELANPAICNPVALPIVPNLKLVKSHTGTFTVGQPASYNLAITNNGGSATRGTLQLSDLLPTGLILATTNPFTSPNGTVTNVVTSTTANGVLVTFDFTPAPAIAVGTTVNITVNGSFSAAAVPSGTSATLTNYASVSGGNDPFPPTPPGTNCVDVSHCSNDPALIKTTADVTIAKALTSVNGAAVVQGQTLKAGDVLLYTITMSNAGGTDATAYALTDATPTATSYVSSSDSGVSTGVAVNWTGLTVPAGSTKAVTVTFKAATPLPPGTLSIANVAYQTGSPPPACPSLNPACVVYPPRASNLKIVKSHTGYFVVGQPASYTLTVTNNGAGFTEGVVRISDLLPNGMTLAATSPITSANGVADNIITNGQLVTFDFTPAPAIAAGGGIATLTLNVTVAASAVGTATNYASVSDGGDPFTPMVPGTGCSDANHCTSDPTLIKPPGVVTIAKALTSVNGVAPVAGQTLKASDTLLYTITLSNATGTTVTGYALTDATPTATSYISSSDAGSLTGSAVNWIGLTVPAGSSKAVTVSFQAASPLPPNVVSISNVAFPTGATPPTCPSVDPACVTYPPTTILKVVKTHTGNFNVGAVGVYNLAISDVSGQPSTNLINITDVLPTGMSLIGTNPITSNDGSISNLVITGQQVTFGFTPTTALTASHGANITISVNQSAAAKGTAVNYVSISGGGDPFARVPPGVACSDVNHCSKDSVVVAGEPTLSLIKTGPATLVVGGTGVYQLTINNTGTGTTNGALTLVDNLPVGFSLNGTMTSGQGTISNVVTTGTAATGFVLNFNFTPTTPLAATNGTASIAVPVTVGVPAAAGSITNYASVGGGGDLSNGGNPPAPGTNCSDVHCGKAVTMLTANNALLSIVKTVNKSEAELGDSLVYTLNITNIGANVVTGPQIVDTLPRGFRLVDNSSYVTGAKITATTGAPGPAVTYTLDTIAPGVSVVLSYRVRVGVGAAQSDGINRAIAHCPHNNNQNCSNQAQAKVKIGGGVFSTAACVAGMIYVDCNGNQIKDPEELGIPGVRMYLEDGTFLISDIEGKYSYCGLTPQTHVLKVDQTTLPRGSRLVSSSNRNVGDANSIFLDLKNGELERADFIEGSCSNTVMEQVKARRTQGELPGPDTEKKHGVPLKFEGKAPDYPQEGTDSANQIIVKPRINSPDDVSRAQQAPINNSERDTPLQQLELNQQNSQQNSQQNNQAPNQVVPAQGDSHAQ